MALSSIDRIFLYATQKKKDVYVGFARQTKKNILLKGLYSESQILLRNPNEIKKSVLNPEQILF